MCVTRVYIDKNERLSRAQWPAAEQTLLMFLLYLVSGYIKRL